MLAKASSTAASPGEGTPHKSLGCTQSGEGWDREDRGGARPAKEDKSLHSQMYPGYNIIITMLVIRQCVRSIVLKKDYR